jgi:Calcineurin-like phosphoesterase
MNRRHFLGLLSGASVADVVPPAREIALQSALQFAPQIEPMDAIHDATDDAIHDATKNTITGRTEHFVLVGDTQRTSWFETALLRREQNDRERVMVLNAIACELEQAAYPSTYPSAYPPAYSGLILLGDHVCYGEESEDWRYFDGIFAPVREQTTQKAIPIIALPGNHDYGLIQRSRAWLQALFERFPTSRNHAFARFPNVVRFGSVAVVTLDTNLDMLSRAQAERQHCRYQALLDHIDHDPRINSVIVAAHHPPFTNSDLAVDKDLMRFAAEPFLAACKTRLFFAGHVHSYERFAFDHPDIGKMFITSGGGGGPRRSVRTDDARLHTNDCYRTGSVRPFHYIRLSVGASELVGEVMMLRKGGQFGGQFVIGDRFSLAWRNG